MTIILEEIRPDADPRPGPVDPRGLPGRDRVPTLPARRPSTRGSGDGGLGTESGPSRRARGPEIAGRLTGSRRHCRVPSPPS